MNAQELYARGDLREAVAAQVEAVKKRPTDADARAFLVELLCISGELDRADVQLDALARTSPDFALSVALQRQLVRAAQWRRQFFEEGRLPEFLELPNEEMQLRLRASVALRDKDARGAHDLLERAEELRPRRPGDVDGQKFDDVRDLDDVCASVLEVLTSTGKYYWIPLERVMEIEMRKPERPRDLLWRRALVDVRDGPEGEVYLPAIYAAAGEPAPVAALLGRTTEWVGDEATPIRGVGLRTFLFGEDTRTILEFERVRFVETV